MNGFQPYLDSIIEPDKKERMKSILDYIKSTFPQLKEEIKWNQPIFTAHGAFIIGFCIAKPHMYVASDPILLNNFKKEIEEAGYSYTVGVFRIKWTDKVDYDLLRKIVDYNIEFKKYGDEFWR